MHPAWILAIVAVGGPFAFLIVHAFFTLTMGRPYEFPIRLHVTRHGPSHCPRCGHSLANHQPANGTADKVVADAPVAQ